MKLSDRNNAVHFLLDSDPVHYRSAEANKITDFINKEFQNMKPLFRQKIQYMCKPFHEAYVKGRDIGAKDSPLEEKREDSFDGNVLAPDYQKGKSYGSHHSRKKDIRVEQRY